MGWQSSSASVSAASSPPTISPQERFSQLLREVNRIRAGIKDRSIAHISTELSSQLVGLKREMEQLNNTYHMDNVDSVSCEWDDAAAQRRRDVLKPNGLQLFQRQEQITNCMRIARRSQQVDLCFLVDGTASMGPYLSELKLQMNAILRELQQRHNSLDIRLACVLYRDYSEEQFRLQTMSFTKNAALFETFLATTVTVGGEDEAEDVFGGIDAALNLPWKYNTRLLIHVGDAPCHGRRFHGGVTDRYPAGDPSGLKIEDLLRRVKSLGIQYFFMHVTRHTAKMIREFNKAAGQADFVKDAVIGDTPHRLRGIVVDSISETIVAASIIEQQRNQQQQHDHVIAEDGSTDGVPPAVDPSGYTIDSEFPDFDASHSEEVFILEPVPPQSISQLCNNEYEMRFSSQRHLLKIAKNPFALGALRAAYHCLDAAGNYHKVLKVFKPGACSREYEQSRFLQQLEVQTAAAFLAEEWNYVKPASASSVYYLDSRVVRFNSDRPERYATIEQHVEGDYQKYNSNCGFVNLSEYHVTLQAFSHWTYQATKEKLIVVDLQGIRRGSTFVLTDPAIHCVNVMRFDGLNLGEQGIKRFFSTHSCNHICAELELKPHPCQKANLVGNKNLMFSAMHDG